MIKSKTKQMKIIFILIISVMAIVNFARAQGGKKPAPKKQPSSQPDINKMMEDAMNKEGMSKEEQEQTKKMMKRVIPALAEQNAATANYPDFTDNKQLIPKKDAARIAAISKKTLSALDIVSYTTTLYNKLIVKGDAADIILVKKIIAQTPKASDISNVTILCMLQGHPHAAMLLSMKAVMMEPNNLLWQNNMASLLTQYGFPEQAMPLLSKLHNDLPFNSTVLNNLGQAWLELGVTDSARIYFSAASNINPFHPESKLCGGLMEELFGDPIKASDEYESAFENCINPFTEQVMKNSNAEFKNPDFEKIKKSIPIYEYFHKNYLPNVPLFTGGVNNYANNKAEQDGYLQMLTDFRKNISAMTVVLNTELDNLTQKGEDEFVNEMMNANLKGVNIISKSATIVMKLLLLYNQQWHEELSKEVKAMQQKIDAWKKEMEEVTNKNWRQEQCHELDAAQNKFMEKVNPMVHQFWLEKAEQQRQILNAIATWNWYVTGNIKNVILMQDIEITGYLVQMYESAIQSQVVLNGYCSPGKDKKPYSITAPQVPNFTCPSVVSIPVGANWQQLTNSIKNFDKNNLNIKRASGPVPNATVSFGTGGTVSQPGDAAFVKTAHSDMSPVSMDDLATMDPVPLPKIGIKHNENNSATHNQLTDRQRLEKTQSNLVKQLIKKMMGTTCKEVKPEEKLKKIRFTVGKGTLEFTDMPEKTYNIYKSELSFEGDPEVFVTWYNEKGEVVATSERGTGAGGLGLESTDANGIKTVEYYNRNGDLIATSTSATTPPAAAKEKGSYKITTQNSGPDVINDKRVMEIKSAMNQIQNTGIQPSISSGIQVPGTFNMSKTLFQ